MSYNRPLETRHYRAVNTVFNAEYPFVRFVEANGYDASYTTGVDSDRRGELIANHRLFLSVGHDEYWSGRQRGRARRRVEVSVDGGATWHPVEGREAWRYEWKPEESGNWTILCRAVDDSGNLEAPAAGVTVTVSEEA